MFIFHKNVGFVSVGISSGYHPFNDKLTSICPKFTVSAMNITFLVKSRPKHTPAAVESLRPKSSALTLN